MRGGFFETPPPDEETDKGNHAGIGPDVYYRKFHYDTQHRGPHRAVHRHRARTGPAGRSTSPRTGPSPSPATGRGSSSSRSGVHRTYLGIDVFEGTYSYRGMRLVPSWGGDMFESLMPDLFVPESTLGPAQLGNQPPAHRPRPHRARARRREVRLLGLLPRVQPQGRVLRVRRRRDRDGSGRLPVRPGGGPTTTPGFGDCREGTNPNPTYGDGVVTPHAAFLAMLYAPGRRSTNLGRSSTSCTRTAVAGSSTPSR